MKRTRRPSIAMLLFSASAFLSGAAASEVPGVCAYPPLLEKYERAGLVSHFPNGQVELLLTADLHAADCGAPDCYGTRIELQISVRREGSGCFIKAASARATDYFGPGCERYGPPGEPRKLELTPQPADLNLANPDLELLTLRDYPAEEALVLTPENFFYFTVVETDGILRTALDPLDGEESGSCWGASSAMLTLLHGD